MYQSSLSKHLVKELRGQFRITWRGHHGVPHWARVRHHGLHLGKQLDANLQVIELFAFLHDSQRENEYTDDGHGRRERGLISIDDAAFELLVTACNGHSDGHMDGDVTVQVCWDADRLDLGRVGIKPDPRRLCTRPARDLAYIEKAWQWGLVHYHAMQSGLYTTDDGAEIVQQGGRYGW